MTQKPLDWKLIAAIMVLAVATGTLAGTMAAIITG
jgi:hypothetical protein